METFKRAALSLLCALSAGAASQAAVNITSSGGWLETCWVEWTNTATVDHYNVYVKGGDISEWQKIDYQLIRKYSDHTRADALGLSSGTYQLKIVPCSATAETTAEAVTTGDLVVKAHDRHDFAHFNYVEGIGAYNNDGTLKKGAKVLYVTAATAKTVKTDVMMDKAPVETVGIQAILKAYEKGKDQTPIAFRFLGTVKKEDLDGCLSNEGLQCKGKSQTLPMNLTFEGVGNDATLWGFGFLIRNARSVEFRNLALICFMDDGLSFDTKNSHCWAHNMDLFYGSTGGDSDQAKGDGSIDIKQDSEYMSVSYCHFWDSGKCSLCGLKETKENYITYHHNWFDHSDSRHPRVRKMSVHVYNNYFDGCAKYGCGATMGSDIFVEGNSFRNVKYPMLTAGQCSDIISKASGTFSGEDGGMIKAWNNKIVGATGNVPYSTSASTQFDYYQANSRDEQVPSGVACAKGGDTYNNFDTDPKKMYQCTPQTPEEAVETIKGTYGAGRCQKGNYSYVFGPGADTDYGVITALKSSLVAFPSSPQSTAFDNTGQFFGKFNFEVPETGTGGGNDNNDKSPGQTVEGAGNDPVGGDSGSGSGSSSGGGQDTNPPATGGEPLTGDQLAAVGDWVVNFTGRKNNNTTKYTITGNYSNDKGKSAATYNGSYLTDCLKVESGEKTTIEFTFPYPGSLTIDMGEQATKPNILVDGIAMSGDDKVFTIELAAGKHTLKKKDSNNIFYMNAEFVTPEPDPEPDPEEEDVETPSQSVDPGGHVEGTGALTPAFGTTSGATQAYTLTGQKASTATRGLLIERQGGKARLKLYK